MFSIKLVDLDMKQGGNMTYLHVFNQDGGSWYEIGRNSTCDHLIYISMFAYFTIQV